MKNLNFIKLLKIVLILLVFAMPLQNRDIFSFFGTRLFPARLLLIAIIMLSAFKLLTLLLSKKLSLVRLIKDHVIKDNLFKALLLLLVVRVVSLTETLNIKASVSLLLFYTSMIALYIILKFIRSKDYKFIRKIFNLYLVVVVLTGIFGLIQALLSPFGIRLFGVLVGSSFIRVPATFYDANHLPPYILSGLPFILVLSFIEKSNLKRVLLYIISAILSLVVFLTFSRSGVLSFLVFFAIFLLYLVWKKYWKKLSFIAVLVCIISLVIFVSSRTSYSLVKRASSVFNLQDKSTVAHGILLYGGLEVWQSRPVLGVGYGGFSEAFRKTQLGKEHSYFDPATDVRLPIHSIWLEALAETGIVGFSIYLYLVILIGEAIYKAFRFARNEVFSLKILALFASFLSILIGGVFYSYNLEFFWFFLFIAYIFSKTVVEEEGVVAKTVIPREPESINWREVLPVLLVVLIAFPILIYNLSFPWLANTTESFFALISKTVHRTAEQHWPMFWVPKAGNEYYFAKPPLIFWLSAFNIYLYDIVTASVRFWPALFSFVSVVITYAIGRVLYSYKRGIASAFVLLSLPLFVAVGRTSTFDGVVVFLAAFFYLSLFLYSKKKPVFNFLLVTYFSTALVLDQYAYFLSLTIFTLTIIRNLIIQKYRKVLVRDLLMLLAVTIFPAIISSPWIYFAYKEFGKEFIQQYFSFNYLGLVRTVVLASLPLIAIFFGKFVSKLNTKLFVLVLSVIALVQILSIQQTKSDSYIKLIERRMEVDRRGIVPLVIATKESSDLVYYSDVPIIFTDSSKIWSYFSDKWFYFVIMGAEDYRKLHSELLKNNIATRVISSQKGILLVEKPGLVP